MIENLAKATVAVALTPVTAIVDTAMIPFDSVENKDVYSRTGKLLSVAEDRLNDALKGEKDESV
jgi:hypothetical protein